MIFEKYEMMEKCGVDVGVSSVQEKSVKKILSPRRRGEISGV